MPAVIGQGVVYFQLIRYSQKEWTKRLIYLTDADKELAYPYEKTDTIAKAMLGLRKFSAVQLADYNQFIKTRPEFLVYSDVRAEYSTT
jgi:hypothetical protein